MRVAFVYSVYGIHSVSQPLISWTDLNFGISTISAFLKQHGHETKLLVLGSDHWPESKSMVCNFFSDFKPDLVCFTAVASQYAFVERVAGFLRKQWPDAFYLIGGVHATLSPEEVIAGPFDGLCIGEGEYPALEVCGALARHEWPSGIANLWIKSKTGQIEKNSPRPFMPELDKLPFPDREMWRPWIIERSGYGVSINLGRGCPYPCTYCCNHALKAITTGRYVRRRSPENILQELKAVHTAFPNKKTIHFEVETITLDKAWLYKLCGLLTEYNQTIGLSLTYSCNYRISGQAADEMVFKALHNAGIRKLNIGLESGSERIRTQVLKRDYSNDDFLKTVAMARRQSLEIRLFNMIGLPGETLADHLETVRLNRQCQPEEHYTGIFYPYPGTELFRTCAEQGWLTDQQPGKPERTIACIASPGFSKAQIQRAQTWFDFRVYHGYKPLWWILLRVLYAKSRTSRVLGFLVQQVSQWRLLKPIRERLRARS